MATIIKDPKSGNWRVAFRYGGQQFTRSLKTEDEREADAIKGRIEETLTLVQRGRIVVPEGADPGTFIVSDGKLERKPGPRPQQPAGATIGDLVTAYADSLPEGSKGENTVRMEKIHLRHVERVLGTTTPLTAIDLAMAQRYVKARLKERHGKRAQRPILAYTIHKELKTFRHAWTWCHRMKLVPVPPSWALTDLRVPKDREPEPFRTMAEIRAILDRGGVSPVEEKRLWNGLYLTGEELRNLLDHVAGLALEGFVYPMFAFAIYTGARRSELLRSRIDDFDFKSGRVLIRELKRRQGRESTRSVDLHPTLATIMKSWFAHHPGGQFTLACDDGSPLDGHVMDHRFDAAVRGTEWAVMRGFHVLRHSFASALAAAGVDQRMINNFMGHQTEQMARRYQHLRPDRLKDAIMALGI
jgi:integrase